MDFLVNQEKDVIIAKKWLKDGYVKEAHEQVQTYVSLNVEMASKEDMKHVMIQTKMTSMVVIIFVQEFWMGILVCLEDRTKYLFVIIIVEMGYEL